MNFRTFSTFVAVSKEFSYCLPHISHFDLYPDKDDEETVTSRRTGDPHL